MRAIFIAPLLALAMAGAVHACPPPLPPDPPPPGESIEAWQSRLAAEAQARIAGYQHQWWTDAQSVLLARVERTGTIKLRDQWNHAYGDSPRVTLRPLRGLKGEGPSRRFRLTYTGLTDCGPYGGGEAVDGRVGDVFLVFVRDGAASQESVITSLALANIVDQDLRDRVAASSVAPMPGQ